MIYNMKKSFLFLLPLLLLASCGEPSINNEIDCPPISGSFARRHLIEHFTSVSCGYCPDGMSAIEEAIKGKDNFIWVGHHVGFAKDAYTIPASDAVRTLLKVNYNPAMVLDRSKITTQTDLVIDPREFPDYVSKVKNNTSFADLSISSDYNAAERILWVTVEGECENPDVHCMLLSVLLKESGMVGAQLDYNNTWNGWSQFRHVHAVRSIATAPLGDTVVVKKGHFRAEYSFNISSKWQADSCSVVAYLSWPNGKKPIINAAQAPVVEGTKGGLDILSGGITMRPVADEDTETDLAVAPSVRFSKALVEPDGEGWLQLTLFSDTTIYVRSSSSTYSTFPLAIFRLHTGSSELVPGTYTLSDSGDMLTAEPGHHMANEMSFTGSVLYYIYTPYWTQYQMLYNLCDFPLRSGEVVVSGEQITFNVTTYLGKQIAGTSVLPTAPAAPKRLALHKLAL